MKGGIIFYLLLALFIIWLSQLIITIIKLSNMLWQNNSYNDVYSFEHQQNSYNERMKIRKRRLLLNLNNEFN